MIACADGQTDIVKYLIQKGADSALKNNVKSAILIELFYWDFYWFFATNVFVIFTTVNVL